MSVDTECREVRWVRMFRDDLEAAFEACPAVFLPSGICAPHGPHQALGSAALRAEAVACRAARQFGGVVAPVELWNIHEIGGWAAWGDAHIGEERPWLTAVPPWIYLRNLCYQIRAAEAVRFRAILLVVGHLGPHERDLRTLIDRLQPLCRARLSVLSVTARPSVGVRDRGHHGGQEETSVLMATTPEAVDLGRLPKDGAPSFGLGLDSERANPRDGEAILDTVVAKLGDQLRLGLADFDPERPSRLTTFDQVDAFWARSMRSRLSELESMRLSWSDDPEPGEGSRWQANHRTSLHPQREPAPGPTANVSDFNAWRAEALQARKR